MKCDTKYPVLLMHGMGFRDRKYFNYWGRIPTALEEEGATLYYGHQDSLGSIEHNASVVKQNLVRILEENQCEKVNIVAHSKGGLEARYMISSLGMADKIASLTTVSTPHQGSKTIDLLLRIPQWIYKTAAFFTDRFFGFLGDDNPDFFTVSHQFSTEHMNEFNQNNPDSSEVYYQSYASVMKNPFSDIIFFWSNLFVELTEGENDGLVTVKSAQWGDFKGVLHGNTFRGISHADVVDIRRINLSKKKYKDGIFDMRTVYIDIVSQLKQMGL